LPDPDGLEHWDRTEVDFQEQMIGRRKYSGAPPGGEGEFDTPDFKAVDGDGNPVIPETVHLRLGAVELDGCAQLLRHGCSYNDGTNFTAERWPLWRQGRDMMRGCSSLHISAIHGRGSSRSSSQSRSSMH
jgi:deferrochelatase/peroxidase EfeB